MRQEGSRYPSHARISSRGVPRRRVHRTACATIGAAFYINLRRCIPTPLGCSSGWTSISLKSRSLGGGTDLLKRGASEEQGALLPQHASFLDDAACLTSPPTSPSDVDPDFAPGGENGDVKRATPSGLTLTPSMEVNSITTPPFDSNRFLALSTRRDGLKADQRKGSGGVLNVMHGRRLNTVA